MFSLLCWACSDVGSDKSVTCYLRSAPSLVSGPIFCWDSSCTTCSGLVFHKSERLLKQEETGGPEASFLAALLVRINEV